LIKLIPVKVECYSGFKVETTPEVYIIKHDRESDRWYLCK